MTGFDLSPAHLMQVVVNLIALILSIAVHEFGHAFVADRLGDRLPRMEGRVTLNPLAHADPIGTLALPAFAMLSGMIGFGWGRPVRINPLAFTRKLRMRTAHLLVAAAGPMMNLLFGTFLALVGAILLKTGALNEQAINAVFGAVLLNYILAFFNLIPAPPLDGGTVLAGILPEAWQPAYQRYARFGILVIIGIVLVPQLRHLFIGPAQWLFTQVVTALLASFGLS